MDKDGAAKSRSATEKSLLPPSLAERSMAERSMAERSLTSHHSSASSLSVKSGVEDEDDDVVDADGDFAGAMVLPSPDAASMLFASAMGHAADASLGDSATRIDLGLANLDSPEVARNASTSISSLAGKLEQSRRHHHDDDDRSW